MAPDQLKDLQTNLALNKDIIKNLMDAQTQSNPHNSLTAAL